MALMYDSITPANIPSDAPIVAGYVDGHWPTYPTLRHYFPTATLVAITVFGAAGVQVCDCETGDLTPAQAAAWASHEVAAGRRPTIYCNTSTHPAVVSALAFYGLQFVRDVDWWEAHYDGNPTLTPGSVAKQYGGTPAYDVSSTDGTWPARPAPKPPAPPVPPPINHPGDNVQEIHANVTIKNGEGWIPVPTAQPVVSAVAYDGNPEVTGGYGNVPAWQGIATAPGPHSPHGALLFKGTADGTFGVVIWAVSS